MKLSNPIDHIRAGVAYHHAGLSAGDKSKVERLFREGQIKVLCATSTLAAGVNLPAHLVIIKSTLQYGPKGYQEYNELDIFQMMGRAGRPQYDTFGVAVIITDDSRKDFYESLCQGTSAIESSLRTALTEYLNSEIALGNVQNLEEARKWLRSTYFYARVQKNPKHYIPASTDDTHQFLMSSVGDIVQKLIHHELLVCDERNGFRTTPYGAAMSKYCLKLETACRFISLTKAASASKVLQILAKSEEFIEVKFAAGDKGTINRLLKESKVRFKESSGRIKEVWEKIFYSIQVCHNTLPSVKRRFFWGMFRCLVLMDKHSCKMRSTSVNKHSECAKVSDRKGSLIQRRSY